MSAAAVPLAAVAFAVWAVYLGGLASLQSDCDATLGTRGIAGTANGNCMRAYRYWWFIMSWEFVVVVGLALAAVSGKLANAKTAFVGLFAVGTLLYIEASNTFLTAQNLDYYDNGTPLHRIRTITAGAIMTAVINAVAVVVLGMDDCAAPAAKAAEDKATGAV